MEAEVLVLGDSFSEYLWSTEIVPVMVLGTGYGRDGQHL